MNILQIISGRGVNGALVYCKILSEELAERGHNVTLICKPGSWMTSNIDVGKVRIVESSLAKYRLDEFRKITRLVREQNFDVIHTHMTRGQNYGVWLKLITGTPVVATAHNSHFEWHWNFNDFVIANSQATFDYHSKINWVPDHRMRTIYCCPDYDRITDIRPGHVERVRQRLKLNPESFLITVVGEVAVRKGHIHLVQALPEILRRVPNAKVVFVGRYGRRLPHFRRVRNSILENGLAGRVKFVGRQKNVAAYLAASQLTVVPSIEEPLGLVAIESLMSGTPVVASDTGGLTEIIRHEQTGLLVPVGDSSNLAAAVIRMAGDEPLRNKLAENGRQHVQTTFSKSILIDQVEQVYNQVAAAPSRKAA